MSRHFNFCSGPATLPLEVLERAREELIDYQGRGLSVMEMSHRGDDFIEIAARAERNLRELLSIPEGYRVLFVQGGASTQFSCVPLNLLGGGGTGNYLDSGVWAKKALAEARHLGGAHVAASTAGLGYRRAPAQDEIVLSPDAAFLHYTDNETIGGVAYDYVPEAGGVPLVCDMSSSILGHEIDVSRFGVIYAGAQKNIGPAGLTVVIVRDDLLDRARPETPQMLSYRQAADHGSMLNTPPTYAWYLCGLVFEWLKARGGVAAIAEVNRRKAARLYAAIDQSEFYSNPIDAGSRSVMNVPFRLRDESLDQRFLADAEAAGLLYLQGHRSVGGMRASIYNAMPEEGVEALIEFMDGFARRHG
ncbi:3-phosphoserine/phosphohydroxythreonine transaminase [Halotalea alkalilenta]|uniref:3-phosphoserine/phosphohydroxythreonine transaminase n=1 Tax=Halotalea alkalilenta TaxID=376489 RepID=UPI00048847C1|nr:3-phosphoserine/phosphohydroxythreonine transaminase [Halotalea alkalilenta]